MSPRIEGQPGESLRTVWVYLSPDEASELRDALNGWAESDAGDPEWHAHIGSLDGVEVTVAIGEPPERP